MNNPENPNAGPQNGVSYNALADKLAALKPQIATSPERGTTEASSTSTGLATLNTEKRGSLKKPKGFYKQKKEFEDIVTETINTVEKTIRSGGASKGVPSEIRLSIERAGKDEARVEHDLAKLKKDKEALLLAIADLHIKEKQALKDNLSKHTQDYLRKETDMAQAELDKINSVLPERNLSDDHKKMLKIIRDYENAEVAQKKGVMQIKKAEKVLAVKPKDKNAFRQVSDARSEILEANGILEKVAHDASLLESKLNPSPLEIDSVDIHTGAEDEAAAKKRTTGSATQEILEPSGKGNASAVTTTTNKTIMKELYYKGKELELVPEAPSIHAPTEVADEPTGSPREGQGGAITEPETLTKEEDGGKAPEAVIEEEFEKLPPEEQKKVSLGLAGLGFKINSIKNKIFAKGFDSVAGTLGKDSLIGRRFQAYSTISEKDAQVSEDSLKELREKKRTGEGAKLKELAGAGALLGNTIALGRFVFDVFGGGIAARVATRGMLSIAMTFSMVMEGEKEARFMKKREDEFRAIKKAAFTGEQMQAFEAVTNSPKLEGETDEEVLERAWQVANALNPDVIKAHEEAIRIMEEAKGRTDAFDGKGELRTEAIEKAFQANIPKDLLSRLSRTPDAATNLIERFWRKSIQEEAKKLNKQIEEIDASEASQAEKEAQKNNILNGFFKSPKLRDFDKAIDQAGVIDYGFMNLRLGQQVADVAKYALMGETLWRTLWNGLPSLATSVSNEIYDYNHPVVPANADAEKIAILRSQIMGEAKMGQRNLAAAEKIVELATIHKGEGITHALSRQLIENPKNFGFTGNINDAHAVKNWSINEALKIAKETGYVAGESETRVGTAGVDKVAYVLGKDQSGNLKVFEELKGDDGMFHEVKGGVETTNTYEYERPNVAPNDVVAEAPARALPAGTVMEEARSGTSVQHKIMSDNWRGKIFENSREDITALSRDTAEVEKNAAAITGYMQSLTALEEKGEGQSENAENIRKSVQEIISKTEEKYGDVFRNFDNFDREVSAPVATPESASSVVIEAPEEVAPSQETKKPGVLDQTTSSAEKVASANAVIESGGMKGSFQYSQEGKIVGFKMDGTTSSLEGRKLLNDNWRGVVLENPRTRIGMGNLNINVVSTNATTVAGYEQLLAELEKKGAGASPEAEFLKREVSGIIADTEKKYGDVFKNEEVATPVATVIEKPSFENSASPEANVLAEKQVHNIVKETFGKEGGWFGIGATDGSEIFNKFAGKPVEEIMNMAPTNDDEKKIQYLISEAQKQTGISPTGKVREYLQNATATNIDKVLKTR
ncbi:MAG: hypothetical protein HZB10_00930 [Candidatus Yonathbacteria bacterium]|nr:hypothetical protein [Candidatus Yonathbacteria bacterium]